MSPISLDASRLSSARRVNGLASRLQGVRHPRRRAPPSDRAAALARCRPSHSTPLASPPPGASTVSLRGCSGTSPAPARAAERSRRRARARCRPSHSTPLASPPPGASTVSLRGCRPRTSPAPARAGRAIAPPRSRDVAHLTRRLSPLRSARRVNGLASRLQEDASPAPARAAERSRRRARAMSPISLDASRLALRSARRVNGLVFAAAPPRSRDVVISLDAPPRAPAERSRRRARAMSPISLDASPLLRPARRPAVLALRGCTRYVTRAARAPQE